MCGIVGFINCGNQSELQNAVEVVNHRGPDGHGVKWFPNDGSGLGHTRLSIIDLSNAANQPLVHEESGLWIVFNGEVYNYKEIQAELKGLGHTFKTNSDTEVVLRAYLQWKESCLERFNGMFAFGIYDPSKQELFAARDRLGIKPFYYLYQDGGFAFSSEIKSILQLKAYKKEPDHAALQTPVHFQITPFTGFKDILKLPAGHFVKFKKGSSPALSQYWDIPINEQPINENEAIEKLDYLLDDAVRLNLVSDVPVGAMLSGGLDSSILCAMMQQKMNQPLNSFTIKFAQKDLKLQGNVDDSKYANILVEKMGFNHHEIELTPDVADLVSKMVYHLDEPIADPASINTYLISKAAKDQGISVLLNGMGADEVFAGYRTQLACLKADPYQKVVPKGLQSLISGAIAKLPENNSKRNFKYIRWVKRFMEVASMSQFDRHIAVKNSALTAETFGRYYTNAMPFEKSYYYQYQKDLFDRTQGSYLAKICYSDSKYYMPDHNLTYSDKSMMAASVEGRPTLIDHRIVELIFGMQPEMRIKGNVQKYLLKKVAEKYVPKEIIYRPKAPFSAPMRGWLKNELKEMVNDLLSQETLERRGMYNPSYVQQLIVNNEKGIEDNSQVIWRLMVNEIWFRTFFN